VRAPFARAGRFRRNDFNFSPLRDFIAIDYEVTLRIISDLIEQAPAPPGPPRLAPLAALAHPTP